MIGDIHIRSHNGDINISALIRNFNKLKDVVNAQNKKIAECERYIHLLKANNSKNKSTKSDFPFDSFFGKK